MKIIFNTAPGTHERHLIRKYKNPLFGQQDINTQAIEQAQQLDAQEVDTFMCDFRELVKKAIDLKPTADADVILKIKEQLDKGYERCSGLAGDQSEVKAMLKKLISVIMQVMWKSIGQDFQAQSKLEMEDKAREAHFSLLEQPLVVDLLRPDTPIDEEELVPTLLSESADAVKVAMQIFVAEQQQVICKLGQELINALDNSNPKVQQAQLRLAEMEAMSRSDNQVLN